MCYLKQEQIIDSFTHNNGKMTTPPTTDKLDNQLNQQQ